VYHDTVGLASQIAAGTTELKSPICSVFIARAILDTASGLQTKKVVTPIGNITHPFAPTRELSTEKERDIKMTSPTNPQDIWKQRAALAAANLVTDGMVIGLGTGTTADYLIKALGERLHNGLHIVGAVASSQASTELAASVNIPITSLDIYPEIDIYIDGADEIDPQMRLIKGAGGALLREKIVASAAKSFVVIADPTKKVEQLGHRFPLPVEVVPLAIHPITLSLSRLGAAVKLRQRNGTTFVTDNHNVILDCTFPDGISDPVELDARIHSIVGVIETGLFINLAKQIIIGGPEGVEIYPQ
jgi:ribose 5-phosphate isomerase A